MFLNKYIAQYQFGIPSITESKISFSFNKRAQTQWINLCEKLNWIKIISLFTYITKSINKIHDTELLWKLPNSETRGEVYLGYRAPQ